MIRVFLFSVLFGAPLTGSVSAQVEAYTVSSGYLFVIDVDTGSYALVGPTNVSASIGSLTLSPSGALYGIGDNMTLGGDALYVFDRETGGATPVGDLGVEGLGSLAITSDGVLWAHLAGTSLYSIDAATGLATSVVALDQTVGALAARDDELFAVSSGAGMLSVYRVDTSSGHLDEVLVTPYTLGDPTAWDFDAFGNLRFHRIGGGTLAPWVDHGFYRIDLSVGIVEETLLQGYNLTLPIAQMRTMAIIDGGSVVGIPALDSRSQGALMLLLLVTGFWFVRRVAVRTGARE